MIDTNIGPAHHEDIPEQPGYEIIYAWFCQTCHHVWDRDKVDEQKLYRNPAIMTTCHGHCISEKCRGQVRGFECLAYYKEL